MISFKLTKKEMILLFLFSFIIVFGFWSLKILLPFSFLLVYLYFKNRTTVIKFTFLDFCFSLFFIGEILGSISSNYKNTSLASITSATVILVLYLTYKKIFKTSRLQELFGVIYFLFSNLLIIGVLVSFVIHKNNLGNIEFYELNNFKNLYNPIGILNSIWVSILLLTIPINTLFLIEQQNTKYKTLIVISLLLTCFCLLISFSRGAYIALFLFYIFINILVFKRVPLKKLAIYNCLFLLIMGSSTLLVKESFLTTVAITKTDSQKRSISGRIDRWKNVKEIIKDKPLLGWGSNNYIFSQDKNPYSSEDARITSRSNNSYLQILIERGIIGFFLYFIAILSILILIFKNLRNKQLSLKDRLKIIVISSGIIAFLFRELTFASFFESNPVRFLFFHLLFFLIPYDIVFKTQNISSILKKSILILSSFFIGYIIYKNGKEIFIKTQNSTFLKENNFKATSLELTNIEKGLENSPNNIVLLHNKALLTAKNYLKINISADHPSLVSFIKTDTVSLKEIKTDLLQILKINPNDALALHNLSWIYYANDNEKKCHISIDKALKLRPYNSYYLISKLLFNLQYSNNTYKTSNILSKAIRYTPDILESIFFKEFSKTQPLIAYKAKKNAIDELREKTKTDSSLILKARLARLLLNDNPAESENILKEVTKQLPNLNRPWMYLAYLNSKNLSDSITTEKLYEKSLQLNSNDYLPKIYYGNYCLQQGKEKQGIHALKKGLQSYQYIATPSFRKSAFFANITGLKTIPNNYIPNELLYYTSPEIPVNSIFKSFIVYYKKQEKTVLKVFYAKLQKKYSTVLFKGEEHLR
jgi:O-antigen ligase/Tfp pilus assembly protein PilF